LADPGIKVLYGDSTESTLQPDILDVVVRLVDCIVAVASGYSEIVDLRKQEQEGSVSTDEILANLDIFQEHVEGGLESSVKKALRADLHKHGDEVISTVRSMIDGWRSRYLGNLEQARGLIAKREAKLVGEMRAALVNFATPMRHRLTGRRIHRLMDGSRYRDEMECVIVPGLRISFNATDEEPEVPRKLKTLLGKGAKLQIGSKLSRIRKIEEPAIFPMDDQILLEAEFESQRVQALLGKKNAPQTTIRLELVPVVDGGVAGRGTRPDGTQAMLQESDGPVMRMLWDALNAEAERVARSPATAIGLAFHDVELDTPAKMFEAVELLANHYRPIIAEIADRSPNVEELAIKHETPDGKREEVWIKRGEVGERLASLRPPMLKRVGIPELHDSHQPALPSPGPAPGAIKEAHAGDRSERIVVAPPPPPPPSSGVPTREVTEDISLVDLDMLVEEMSGGSPDDKACTDPPVVRKRDSP